MSKHTEPATTSKAVSKPDAILEVRVVEMDASARQQIAQGLEHGRMMAHGPQEFRPIPDWLTPASLEEAERELREEAAKRALKWEQARQQVQAAREELRATLERRQNRWKHAVAAMEFGEYCLHKDTEQLLTALDELDRLEGAV